MSSSGAVEQLSFHDVLAQVVIVSATFTFSEEDKKAFGHIHAKELIPISNYGSECCEKDSLRDTMISKELAPERGNLKVEFDHQSTVETLYFRQVIQDKRDKGLTPKTPMMTKKTISKKCQSLSYVTWKSTSFPVRKGFIACLMRQTGI